MGYGVVTYRVPYPVIDVAEPSYSCGVAWCWWLWRASVCSGDFRPSSIWNDRAWNT